MALQGGAAGAAAQTGAEAGWNYFSGESLPTVLDWQRNIMLGAAGGFSGSVVQRYTPGTGMNRYTQKYQNARTEEGNWLISPRARFQATRSFRTKFRHPLRSTKSISAGFVHHERAVSGYPELFDDFDIMTWLPSEDAHVAEHLKNANVIGANPLSSITHGPKTPRFPGIPSFPAPLGTHDK